MIIKGQTDYKYHIKKALFKMQKVNKWQFDFILEIFLLFLSIKGKLNFLQLGNMENILNNVFVINLKNHLTT